MRVLLAVWSMQACTRSCTFGGSFVNSPMVSSRTLFFMKVSSSRWSMSSVISASISGAGRFQFSVEKA